MVVVSSRDFRDNQRKYFELATKQRVIIKRKKEFLELVPRGTVIPENPSPSNDPYFDNPKNIEGILEAMTQVVKGELIEYTPELRNQLFGEFLDNDV